MKQKRTFVVYPLLVSAYFVLALAAKNSAEVRLTDLILPLALSLAAAALVLAVAAITTRDPHLAGIVALSVVVWFGWYGYIEAALAPRLWLQWINLPDYGVPLLLILLAAPAYFIARRFAVSLPAATRYLNATSVVLTAIPVLILLRSWIAPTPTLNAEQELPRSSHAQRSAGPKTPSTPDIYLIVLDEYTGPRSLRANFGFDNSPFLDSLRHLGFSVPNAPRSNYVHTHLALAALLNWELLSNRPAGLKAWNGALAIDYTAIEDNRTWRYLHDLGYRFVFFPSAYPGTRRNKFADIQLPDPGSLTPEFGLVWIRSTVIVPIASLWCRKTGCGGRGFPFKPATADLVEWKFQQMAALPDSSGPLFVFAHLLLPHEPFIFRHDCTHREPLWPRSASESDAPEAKAAYVEQIRCLDSKLLQLVSVLLRNSEQPPIIILQADHGNGRLGRDFAPLEEAGRERVTERTEPFAAYFLPNRPDSVIYDSITPVNVLPRIFNHYFDAGIPLQPDLTYWSTWQEPFAFTQVP